nr:20 kDa chaperonin, chloroplastic-like [Ipomoea batatas]
MTTTQLTASTISAKGFALFEGLRSSSAVKIASFAPPRQNISRSFPGLVVKAATTITPKGEGDGFTVLVLRLYYDEIIFSLFGLWTFVSTYTRYFLELIEKCYTSLKPLGDRVLVKLRPAEEKSVGGILLPTTAQSKPQGGEVVAVGEGREIGKNKVEISVKVGTQIVYSKYAGTELEFNGAKHLILKEDDIVGILDTDDVRDLKPLNDRVLIKVAEVEEKTSGGLLLSAASKEKPSIGTVLAVGPGPLDEEGNRKSLSVSTGSTILFSKYAGNEFKGVDGSDYIVLRVSDVIAVLS